MCIFFFKKKGQPWSQFTLKMFPNPFPPTILRSVHSSNKIMKWLCVAGAWRGERRLGGSLFTELWGKEKHLRAEEVVWNGSSAVHPESGPVVRNHEEVLVHSLTKAGSVQFWWHNCRHFPYGGGTMGAEPRTMTMESHTVTQNILAFKTKSFD